MKRYRIIGAEDGGWEVQEHRDGDLVYYDEAIAPRAEGVTTVPVGEQASMHIGIGASRLFTVHVDPSVPDDEIEIRAYKDGPVLCRITNLATV